ncbi:MAG TPA: hypothetical protein VFB19_19210 [Mycobacterium sp.]|nr:hypothetical protein [Mycobacterium sp.]
MDTDVPLKLVVALEELMLVVAFELVVAVVPAFEPVALLSVDVVVPPPCGVSA